MFWFRRKREEKRLAEEQRLRLEREEARRRYEEEQRRREEEQRKFLEEQRRQIEARKEQERLQKQQNERNVNMVDIDDDESVTLTDYSLFHCSLVAVSGEYQGAEIPIGADEFVMIGRNPTRANIVLNHASISSLHCQIRYSIDDRCFQVVDFSRYGTYVNGHRLQQNIVCNCNPGSVVRFAESDNNFQLKVERSL